MAWVCRPIFSACSDSIAQAAPASNEWVGEGAEPPSGRAIKVFEQAISRAEAFFAQTWFIGDNRSTNAGHSALSRIA